MQEMTQYGYSYVDDGRVIVKDGDGKLFFSASLSIINVPLVKPILDSLFGS